MILSIGIARSVIIGRKHLLLLRETGDAPAQQPDGYSSGSLKSLSFTALAQIQKWVVYQYPRDSCEASIRSSSKHEKEL